MVLNVILRIFYLYLFIVAVTPIPTWAAVLATGVVGTVYTSIVSIAFPHSQLFPLKRLS